MNALEPRDPNSVLWNQREKLGLTLIKNETNLLFEHERDFYQTELKNVIVTANEIVWHSIPRRSNTKRNRITPKMAFGKS